MLFPSEVILLFSLMYVYIIKYNKRIYNKIFIIHDIRDKRRQRTKENLSAYVIVHIIKICLNNIFLIFYKNMQCVVKQKSASLFEFLFNFSGRYKK